MQSRFEAPSLPTVQVNEFLPSIHRWMTWGGMSLVGLLGIAMTVSSVVPYKVAVRGTGTVRPVGELRLVQAATSGTIREIRVSPYQSVQQGDVIAILDSARLQLKREQIQNQMKQLQLQRVQITAQISSLERQMAAETERIHRAITAATAELEGRRRAYHDQQQIAVAKVEEAEASLGSAKAALEAARSKHNRYQTVANSGAISQDQLEETALHVTQQAQSVAAAAAALQQAKAALNPTDAEITSALAQVAQQKASGQASLANLDQEQQALVQQRLELDKQLEQATRETQQIQLDLQQTRLIAPSNGVIAKLNLRNPGQTVHAGEQIAQIVPQQSPLEVKVAVSSADIEKIRPGQKAQMRVSSCAYPDYGTLNGIVYHIAQDSVKPEVHSTEQSTNPSSTVPIYEVIVQPQIRSLTRGHRQCILQPGMAGRVDIVTQEETVLRFLLRKARLMSNL